MPSRSRGARTQSPSFVFRILAGLRIVLHGWVIVGLVLAGVQGSTVATAQSTAELPSPDDVGAVFEALERYRTEVALDDVGVDSLVLEIGFDVTDIHAWVRDATSLVAYQGALRGSQGVLMDRVGNSLDRALLLADLLDAAGEEVRLVRGLLESGTAHERYARPLDGPTGFGASVAEHATDDLDEVLAGLPAGVAEAVAESERAGVRFHEELESRVTAQEPIVARWLTNSGTDASDRTTAIPSEYWWVQVARDGSWTHVDPGAETVGTAPADVVESLTPPTHEGLIQRHPDLAHAVSIRVVAECFSDGDLAENVLVDTGAVHPAALLGSEVSVGFAPVGWPEGLVIRTDNLPDVEIALQGVQAWVPVVRAGGEPRLDRAFSMDCEFPLVTSLSELGSINEAAGGATDMFSMLPGGEDGEEDESAAAQATAVWIEFTFHVPGAVDTSIRRFLVDRIGERARLGLAEPTVAGGEAWKLPLLGRTDVLLQAHGISQTWVDGEIVDGLVANRDAFMDLARAAAGQDVLEASALDLSSWPPAHLYGLAIARQHGFDQNTYIGSVNVFTSHVQPAAVDGELRIVQSFDIVANEVGVHPGVPAETAAILRAGQGIRDTNAEALLVRLPCMGGVPVGITCTPGPSAADSLADGVTEWILLADVQALDELEAIPTGVADALGRGSTVAIAAEGESVWWELRSSGGVLGHDASGWGQSAAEYALTIGLNIGNFVFCDVDSSNPGVRAACVAGAFLGWGSGIAALGSRVVAGRVLAVVAFLVANLPKVVETHSR